MRGSTDHWYPEVDVWVTVFAVLLVAGCGRVGFDVVGPDLDDARAAGDGNLAACRAAFDVCDDFEAPTLSTQWSTHVGVALDQTLAHTGLQSAHISIGNLTTGQASEAALVEVSTLSVGGPFWVRAWVRMATLPASTNVMALMFAEQVVGPEDGVYAFVVGNETQIYSNFDSSTAGGGVGIAPNVWTCAVWHVVRSASQGTLALRINTMPELTLSGRTDGAPPMARLGIGIQFAAPNVNNPQPAMNLWVDDIIVDANEVTCSD